MPQAQDTTPPNGGELPSTGQVVVSFTNVQGPVEFRLLVDLAEVPFEVAVLNDPRDFASPHLFGLVPQSAPAVGSSVTVQWCAADCDSDQAMFDTLSGFTVVEASTAELPTPTLSSFGRDDVEVVTACDGTPEMLPRFRAAYDFGEGFDQPLLVRLSVTVDGTVTETALDVANAPGAGMVDVVSTAAAPSEDSEVCGIVEAVDLSGSVVSAMAMECTEVAAGTSTGTVDDGADDTSGGADTTGSTPPADGDDAGCGCRSTPGHATGWLLLLALGCLRRRSV